MAIISPAVSTNGTLIRLTDERWKHILLLHPNLGNKQELVLKAVDKPSFIFKGRMGEFLAASELSKRRFLVVVYKEIDSDGFVITAFETTDTRWLFKKELIWSNS